LGSGNYHSAQGDLHDYQTIVPYKTARQVLNESIPAVLQAVTQDLIVVADGLQTRRVRGEELQIAGLIWSKQISEHTLMHDLHS